MRREGLPNLRKDRSGIDLTLDQSIAGCGCSTLHQLFPESVINIDPDCTQRFGGVERVFGIQVLDYRGIDSERFRKPDRSFIGSIRNMQHSILQCLDDMPDRLRVLRQVIRSRDSSEGEWPLVDIPRTEALFEA